MPSTAEEISIVAILIVLVVILAVALVITMAVRFLRRTVDAAGKVAPTFECVAWLELRQQKYLEAGSDNCSAIKQAISDSQISKLASPCPIRKTPPDAYQQSPYDFYMAQQNCLKS